MKNRILPAFDPDLKHADATVLEWFVFNNEPEGVKESAKFRKELLAVLNGCGAPYDKWVDPETNQS